MRPASRHRTSPQVRTVDPKGTVAQRGYWAARQGSTCTPPGRQAVTSLHCASAFGHSAQVGSTAHWVVTPGEELSAARPRAPCLHAARTVGTPERIGPRGPLYQRSASLSVVRYGRGPWVSCLPWTQHGASQDQIVSPRIPRQRILNRAVSMARDGASVKPPNLTWVGKSCIVKPYW